ncbi:MAG: hypothetical protein V4812_22745 [Pseudomonadota bacterium]
MTANQCVHRNHTIAARLIEYPGIPTPWAGGCSITTPDGRQTPRIPLPRDSAFLSELDSARRASLAHGRWLVDQSLDRGKNLF